MAVWHVDKKIAERRHFSTAVTREADAGEAFILGRCQSVYNGHAVAGSGNGYQNIAAVAERQYLLGEHLLVTKVVGNGRQDGGIGGKGNGREGGAVEKEAVDELGCQMLAVGCAATVAAEKEFVPLGKAKRDAQGKVCDGGRFLGEKLFAEHCPLFTMFNNGLYGFIEHKEKPSLNVWYGWFVPLTIASYVPETFV